MHQYFVPIVLAILTLTTTALADEASRPSHPCGRADARPDAAQALTAFNGLPRIYLRDDSKVTGKDWAGVDDLSATARLSFDDANLYVLVEVMDNDLQFPQALDAYTWSRDSIQIAFDPLNDGGVGYSPDDVELLMTMIGGKAAIEYQRAPGGVSLDSIKDVETFAARHPHVPGWYFYAAIPWKTLGIADAKVGQSYGVNILVNDRDASRERQFMEWTRGIGLAKDPSSFARLDLVDKPAMGDGGGLVQSETHPETWAEKFIDLSDLAVDGAVGGQVRTSNQDGIYCWWPLETSLPAGAYRVYARVAGKGTLGMKVYDADGDRVIQALPDAKVNSKEFGLIELGKFQYNGRYSLRISDWSTGGLLLDYVAVKADSALSEAVARKRATAVRNKAVELDHVLVEAETAGLDVRDQRITYHTVQLFSDFAVDDAQRGKVRRAERVLKFIEAAVPRAVNEVKQKIAAGGPKSEPLPDVSNLTWRNGHFYSGDRPVFLFGILDAPTEWAVKLGMNYAYGWTPLDRLIGSEEQMNLDGLEGIASRIRESRAAGLAVSHLLGLHYFPESIYNEIPETHQAGDVKSFRLPCLDSPVTMRLISTVLRQAPPELSKAGLLGWELANEPGYACRCEYTRQAFVEYLRREYETPAAVGEAWGSPLAKFEDAQLPPETASGAAGFDWHDFNQQRVARIFTEMCQQVAEAEPKLATEYKIVAGRALDGSDLTWGIDHEAIAQSSPSWTGNDTYFSEAGIARAMIYDLYRSFAQDRPIVDHECPYVRPGSTADRTRFNMWISVAHGEAGASLWLWNRNESAPDNEDCIATQPWSMEAFGRTIGEINRLAPELVALSTVKPQVRILYSRSSSIVSPRQHLPEMNVTYREVVYLGAPIGFITERQLAAGQFADTKLIIIPAVDHLPDDALAGLNQFAKAGGTIVLNGSSAFSSPRGKARADAEKPSGSNVIPPQGGSRRTAEGYAKIFDHSGVARAPHARQSLEVREAQMPDGNVVRIYLNYGSQPATVALAAQVDDLIARGTTDRLSIPPNGVALIRLAAPSAAAE